MGTVLALGMLGMTALDGAAQGQRSPKAIVAAAVQTELNADRDDHTAFMYRDHDVTPEHDTVYYAIETPEGTLRRELEDHGHPLTPEQRREDDQHLQQFLADASAQQKAKKDSVHDDEQAETMLKLLPVAFTWTVKSETADTIVLDFKPDPNYSPTSLEARVLSAMAGEIAVAREQDRIRSIRGALLYDVKIGFGILGRLKQGGTFQVERHEVAPRHWQVTDSHVHIVGKAMFFKSIGSEEDETRSDFKPSPAETLKQAYPLLPR